MSDYHSGGTTGRITDFTASNNRLFIFMNDGIIFDAESPKLMWNASLQGWVPYCPDDANAELSMCLGNEVCINLSNRIIEIRLPGGKLFAAYSTREDL